MPEQSSSALGLVFQAAGIALIAMLSLFLRRTIRRDYLSYWSAAWTSLALSLGSLFLSFAFERLRVVLEAGYYFGEYAFGMLLVAGCRNFARGERIARRDFKLAFPPLLLALALPRLPGDFSFHFIVQAAVLACLFVAGFVQLEHAREPSGPGLSVMRVALVLLAVCFGHYVPVFSYSFATGTVLPVAYSAYSSIYDLIFEVLLAFGMVILTMEDVQRQLQATNQELRAARDRAEALLRLDPLTESLSRHALYSFVEESHREKTGVVPVGCVAVVDIDDLKPINDSYGHVVGDDAIRAVARAIRSVVRADDLVFRWGGDEFLVVLFGVPEEDTSRRLNGLNEDLKRVQLPGASAPIDIAVSFGVAAFSTGTPLERAIEVADDRMYLAKQARKAARAAPAKV